MTASKLPLILALLFLGGCAERNPGSLPYKYWRLGFLAPDHMEVWVETADVEDIRGYRFFHVGSGTVSVHLPTDGTGNAVGWTKTWGQVATSTAPIYPGASTCAGNLWPSPRPTGSFSRSPNAHGS